jgi:serine/threonine protein kinase
MESLRKHYTDEIRTTEPFPHDAQAQLPYPYPQRYNKRDSSGTVGFTYVSEGPAGRIIYSAKTDNGERICVKYTRTYSEELHDYCASNGSAPQLRACERLPGGWLMIVMDAIDLSVYTLLSEIPNDDRPTVNARLLPAVEKLVNGFHEAGLVHGDIRRSNILVNDSGFLLIDFDWAGRVGYVQYPSNVNHSGVLRPEGARDGELISIEHDLDMLYSAFSDK